MGIKRFYAVVSINGVTRRAVYERYTGRKEQITETTRNREFFIIDVLAVDANSIIYVVAEAVTKRINAVFYYLLYAVYSKTNSATFAKINKFREIKIDRAFVDEFIDEYNMAESLKECENVADLCKCFQERFSSQTLQKIVINETIYKMAVIVFDNTDKDLKVLLLAYDGVPPRAKMNQQRDRRYTSAVEELVHKKIIQECHRKGIISELDYIYETNRISFNRGNLAPGTGFMTRLVKKLRSPKVYDIISKGSAGLQLIISGPDEIGEGEKKIVNFIKQNYTNSDERILVYSPDADVILLCMLAPVKHIFMLRNNPQTGYDDLIDIAVLKSSIFDNCKRYCKEQGVVLSDTLLNRIAYDIVILSTFFGNDFLPKIETVNIDDNFTNLINIYAQTWIARNERSSDIQNEQDTNTAKKTDKNEKYFLLTYSTDADKYSLSFEFLKALIGNLLPVEKDRIENDIFYNTFTKANLLKSVFQGSGYLGRNESLTMKNVDIVVKEFQNSYRDLTRALSQRENYTIFLNNNKFMDCLKKAILIVIDGTEQNTNILTNKELIDLIKKEKYENKHKFYAPLKIKMFEQTHSINQGFHKQDVAKKRLLDYQIELYKFDELLDEWYDALQPKPINWKTYVSKYLGSETDACKEYTVGLFWMIHQYCNKTDYLNNWFYTRQRAPLLGHLHKYLNSITSKDFSALSKILSKYRIDTSSVKTIPSDYFNPLSQFVYVSPPTVQNLEVVPSGYKKWILTHKKDLIKLGVFCDFEQVADVVFESGVVGIGVGKKSTGDRSTRLGQSDGGEGDNSSESDDASTDSGSSEDSDNNTAASSNDVQDYVDFTNCHHFRDCYITALKNPTQKNDQTYFDMIVAFNKVEKTKMNKIKKDADSDDEIIDKVAIRSKIIVPKF